VFLGLASRLVSPSLGAAALSDVVPYLTLDNLWWRPVNGGPVPLAAGPTAGREIGGAETGRQLDDAAAMLSEHCVRGMASPVAGVFQGLFRLSPLVLRGNIASALAGAAGMLARSFPDRAETAAQLTARMLALEPLRGTGELVQPDISRPRRFLIRPRRSCGFRLVEVVDLVPELVALGDEVAEVVRGDRGLERDAGGDVDAAAGQRVTVNAITPVLPLRLLPTWLSSDAAMVTTSMPPGDSDPHLVHAEAFISVRRKWAYGASLP
jgi:hypothetical protein